MNSNRMAWLFSVVSLGVAIVACLVAFSPRLGAQEPLPAEPYIAESVVALPIDGQLIVESAMVDPGALDAAVGAAFTFQGVLRSGSAGANGSHDFQFSLYTAASGGTQRGPTLVAENVPVSQGRFTTVLNFGNFFGNEALWIAIGVRSGTSTGAFTALNPRQGLTAVPFARYAAKSGETTALQAQIDTLKTQVSALQTLLAGVSRVDNGATLRFSNMNVQVVSGSGATDGAVNGRGNLIVGYNEPNPEVNHKGGSHMLVLGMGNTYSSYGGLIGGRNGSASAPFGSIVGGVGNFAVAGDSVVVGGVSNSAEGAAAAILGGSTNRASGEYSAVSGGFSNDAEAELSTISGGDGNWITATASRSTVGGGVLGYLQSPNVWAGKDYCEMGNTCPSPP